MAKPIGILIHHFRPCENPSLDDDGDERDGFYYQFSDELDLPVGAMMGPYRYKSAVEAAAVKAFRANDF